MPTLTALVTALGTHPEWRYERAGEIAERCRELLAEHAEVLTPSGHSTLVTFRPSGDPTELVASLEQRGVIVRELRGGTWCARRAAGGRTRTTSPASSTA